MIRLKLLLPFLGIPVAIAPYILRGRQLVWIETILGGLILLTGGFLFIAEYFRFGSGSQLKKSRLFRNKP